MSQIELCNITKSYDKRHTVMSDLNLAIEDGSFTVLVGPSGCGKTTLLRMIAGLEAVSKGRIFIGREDVTELPAGKREIAMVFQNYAIYPHMSVSGNIEFGLKNAKVPTEQRKRIVKDVIHLVGLDGYEAAKPSQLSGGQRQRVALARAISKKPRVFLMDEPLSNLDAKLRNQMRSEIIQLHHQLKSTFVYVTHDQIEAMTMGDQIVLMNHGEILQTGSPLQIYRDPQSVFVAQFIGDPGMNIFSLSDRFFVGVRPRKIFFAEPQTADFIAFDGLVLTREILGSEVLYCIQTQLGQVMLKTNDETYEPDREYTLYVAKHDLYFFAADERRIYDAATITELYEEVKGHVAFAENQ